MLRPVLRHRVLALLLLASVILLIIVVLILVLNVIFWALS